MVERILDRAGTLLVAPRSGVRLKAFVDDEVRELLERPYDAARPPLRYGPPPLRGVVQLRLRRSCRTPLGLRPREFELTRQMSGVRKWFSGKYCYGAPGEIRTPGLLVRSQALYPTELRAQCAMAEREGLFATAPLIPRVPLGTAVAKTLRRLPPT